MGCKESHQGTNDLWSEFKYHELCEVHCRDRCINRNKKICWRTKDFTILKIFSRFTIELAAACAIIETALIFYIHETEEELSQKFHDQYLLSIFKNKDEDE